MRIPESTNEDAATSRLAAAVEGLDLPLLVHASEEVGHAYGGKEGGFTPGGLWRLLSEHRVRVIAAHWGGGFPFYALMPEVAEGLSNVLFDTAASPFLYRPAVFESVASSIGVDRVLMGSDYPLVRVRRLIHQIDESSLSDADKLAIKGGNAARLLGT